MEKLSHFWEIWKTVSGCIMLIPAAVVVYYILMRLWKWINFFTEIEFWICLPFGRYGRMSERAASWLMEHVEWTKKNPSWHNRYRGWVAELAVKQYEKYNKKKQYEKI